MAKPLAYAMECRKRYSPGREEAYVSCILAKAHYYSTKRENGVDKDVVRRATETLLRLQKHQPSGVAGQKLRSQAGFTAYNGPNDGLWPWLDGYGGLPVVEKMQGRKYRIADNFYPVLQRVLGQS